MRALKLIAIASILGAPVLSTTAHSQLLPSEGPRASSELTSLVDCARPDGAKEAKVVEFDAGKSLAKLAVNLGSGRFKLVRITVLDRSEDARPLVPVLEAARIMQGVVTFYTPVINTDPESAHDSFLLIAEMGATPICWAIPGSLLNESRGLGQHGASLSLL